MMADDHLDKLVQQLLAPLTGAEPAGRWMRYERTFTDIARLREEDNPLLPMGEWERPLVKADWRKVAQACIQLLDQETKDFQVAAWLCDAWTRTSGLQGLHAGLNLITGMAERYWTSAWPAMEDDDAERRVAPFVWMNANLPLTLRLSTLLLRPVLHRETAVTLLDWERAPSADDAKAQEGEQRNRREIRESVKPADGEWLKAIDLCSDEALATLERLSHLLDKQLAAASPSLSKLADAITSLRQATQSLLKELPPPVETMQANSSSDSGTSAAAADSIHPQAIPVEEQARSTRAGAEINLDITAIGDREQAYAALMSIAVYLQRIEPHSPTPYLIQRAVELGQLNLPDMIRDVSASAGSLDKFFELLGITPPG
jgi:type VI secretion system protein ImpA